MSKSIKTSHVVSTSLYVPFYISLLVYCLVSFSFHYVNMCMTCHGTLLDGRKMPNVSQCHHCHFHCITFKFRTFGIFWVTQNQAGIVFQLQIWQHKLLKLTYLVYFIKFGDFLFTFSSNSCVFAFKINTFDRK